MLPYGTHVEDLLRAARSSPHEATLHGAVADALEEEHGENPLSYLLRRQYGILGTPPVVNIHYDPAYPFSFLPPGEEPTWLPQHEPLGVVGPFEVSLGHERNSHYDPDQQDPRWVVHARAPAGDDGIGYTFEFSYRDSPEIGKLFPHAAHWFRTGTDPSDPDHDTFMRHNAQAFENTMQQRRESQDQNDFEMDAPDDQQNLSRYDFDSEEAQRVPWSWNPTQEGQGRPSRTQMLHDLILSPQEGQNATGTQPGALKAKPSRPPTPPPGGVLPKPRTNIPEEAYRVWGEDYCAYAGVTPPIKPRFPAEAPATARKDLREGWHEFTNDPDLEHRIWNHPGGNPGGGYNVSKIKGSGTEHLVTPHYRTFHDAMERGGALENFHTSHPAVRSRLEEARNAGHSDVTIDESLLHEMNQWPGKRKPKPEDAKLLGMRVRFVKDFHGRMGMSHVFPAGHTQASAPKAQEEVLESQGVETPKPEQPSADDSGGQRRFGPEENWWEKRYSAYESDYGADDGDMTSYVDHDHADFHAAMHDNPEEMTNHHAYADFLEENGQLHTAGLIRKSLAHRNDLAGGNHGYFETGYGSGHVELRPGEFSHHVESVGGHPGRYMNVLRQRSAADPTKEHNWYSPVGGTYHDDVDPQDVNVSLRRSYAEGSHVHTGSGWVKKPKEVDWHEGLEPPEALSRYDGMTSYGTHEELLDALRANPEESTLRGAYADFLEENGYSEPNPHDDLAWKLRNLKNSPLRFTEEGPYFPELKTWGGGNLYTMVPIRQHMRDNEWRWNVGVSTPHTNIDPGKPEYQQVREEVHNHIGPGYQGPSRHWTEGGNTSPWSSHISEHDLRPLTPEELEQHGLLHPSDEHTTRYELEPTSYGTREELHQTMLDNPLDSTSHMVLADFLDESGEHDEAAFRRQVGDYMQRAHAKGHKVHNPDWSKGAAPDVSRQRPWVHSGITLPFLGSGYDPHVPGEPITFRTYPELKERFRLLWSDKRHVRDRHMPQARPDPREELYDEQGHHAQPDEQLSRYDCAPYHHLTGQAADDFVREGLDLLGQEISALQALCGSQGCVENYACYDDGTDSGDSSLSDDPDQSGASVGVPGGYTPDADFWRHKTPYMDADDDTDNDVTGHLPTEYGDHEEFVKAIHANPLEATNHLVHADWLEENGQPEEAAFRRAMGEWMQTRHGQRSYIPGDSEASLHGTHHWWAERHQLPEGVDDRFFDRVARRDERQYPHESYSPSGWIHNWVEYPHMEEAFRRAFMTGRRQEPEQLSAYWNESNPQNPWELQDASLNMTQASMYAEHSDEDFHRAMHENPDEHTNSLVYADWLEENGRPGLAAHIRQAVDEGLGGWHQAVTQHTRFLNPGEFGLIGDSGANASGGPWVRLVQRSASHPDTQIQWGHDIQVREPHPYPQVQQVVSDYLKEGVRPSDTVRWHFVDYPKQLAGESDPTQASRYADEEEEKPEHPEAGPDSPDEPEQPRRQRQPDLADEIAEHVATHPNTEVRDLHFRFGAGNATLDDHRHPVNIMLGHLEQLGRLFPTKRGFLTTEL